MTQFLARPAVWALFPRSTYQLARSGRHPPAGVPVGGVRLDGLSCPSHAPAPRRPEPRACHSKDEFKLRSQSPIRSFQSAVRRTTGPCGRAAEEEQTEGWDNEELVGLAGRHGPPVCRGTLRFFFSSAVAGQGGEPARPVRGRNRPTSAWAKPPKLQMQEQPNFGQAPTRYPVLIIDCTTWTQLWALSATEGVGEVWFCQKRAVVLR